MPSPPPIHRLATLMTPRYLRTCQNLSGHSSSLCSKIRLTACSQKNISRPPYPTGEHPSDIVWRIITGDTGLATIGSERPVQDVDRIRSAAFSHLYRPKARLPEPFRVTVDGTDKTELFSLADAYHQQVAYIQERRRGRMTEKRFLTVLPDTAEIGDLIVLVLGVNMPLLVRRIESVSQVGYQSIGEAFVHGIMDGELMNRSVGGADGGWKINGAIPEEIRIV